MKALTSHPLFPYGILAALVIGAAAFYLSGAATYEGGRVLPLDDAYIHLQYARAVAEGHPFQYIAGQPPTSGATSLLYPLLVAPAFTLRLDPPLWALAIGMFSTLASAWLVYGIVGGVVGIALAACFVVHGSLLWAALSGMETALFSALCLWTLRYARGGDPRKAIFSGTLAALIRPEGAVIGVGAALYAFARTRSRRFFWKHLWLYALPLAAALVQPLLNFIYTGSLTASGMQAKAFLFNVPPNTGEMLRSVSGYAVRLWREFLSLGEPDYGTLVLTGAALAWIAFALWRGVRRPDHRLDGYLAGMIVLWFIGITALVSLLETGFWQFKRYQQPLIALFFPLAGWLMLRLWRGGGWGRLAGGLILAGVALQSLTSGIAFRGYYAENTAEVAGSQRPMASYVAESVPAGAVVGVHDIGVAAFYGQHPTYDLVGLTTPNAAVAWRNGPGAVYESMARSPYRPDYLAIYPDARGLTYFAGTGLFANPLAEFPSLALPHNVASATNSGQTVYKIDWSPLDGQEQPRQPSTLTAIGDLRLVDVLNIAYLPDEATHEYHWWQAAQPPGFPTELYRQSYVACAADCTVQDGGRLITGGESFTMATRPAEDALWVIRVHPRQAMTITLYAGDQVVGQRVIPAIPGTWIEIPTLITGDKITTERTTFRVEAALNDPSADHYMPYQHWLYQGRYPPVETPTEPPLAQFDAGFAVQRAVLNYAPDSRVFSATITWFNGNSPAPVDGILFIHLYDKYDGLRQDAQIDQRPGGGALPPGNWLPGGFTETYQRRLPSSIAPGVYRVAIGMYDPLRGRLPLEGEGVDTDLRLWVGTITVE